MNYRKNKVLESELSEYKHRHQTTEQAAQPQLQATQAYGGSNFMSQVLENVSFMQNSFELLSFETFFILDETNANGNPAIESTTERANQPSEPLIDWKFKEIVLNDQ